MELTEYWTFVRRWMVLLVCGTLLAAVVAVGVTRVRQSHSGPSYTAAASVWVHYVVPFGAPYNATISPRLETVALKQYANDPAVLETVSHRLHIRRSQIASVTASIDPDVTMITLQVTGNAPATVASFARGLASYLVTLHAQHIQSEVRTMRGQLAPQVAAAHTQWLTAQTRYNALSSRTTAGGSGGDATALATLQAEAGLLQQDYSSLSSQYRLLGISPLPAATVQGGQGATIVPQGSTLSKTVLPAALLGFMLALGVAALLDYRGATGRERTRQRRLLTRPSAVLSGSAGGGDPDRVLARPGQPLGDGLGMDR